MRPIAREGEFLRDKYRVIVIHKRFIVRLFIRREEGRGHDHEVSVPHLRLLFIERHLMEDVEHKLHEPPGVRGERLDQGAGGVVLGGQVSERGFREFSNELLDDPRYDVNVFDFGEWGKLFVVIENVHELVELALHRREPENTLLVVVCAVDAGAAVRDEIGNAEDDRGAPGGRGLVRNAEESGGTLSYAKLFEPGCTESVFVLSALLKLFLPVLVGCVECDGLVLLADIFVVRPVFKLTFLFIVIKRMK